MMAFKADNNNTVLIFMISFHFLIDCDFTVLQTKCNAVNIMWQGPKPVT